MGFTGLRILLIGICGGVSTRASSPLVLVGLYNTSTWDGHPAETSLYAGVSVEAYLLDGNGTLRLQRGSSVGLNVSWIIPHPVLPALFYAVNEVGEYLGTATGSVVLLRLNRSTGELRTLDRVSSGGAGPVHLSVHSSGSHLLIANYNGGSLQVLALDRSSGYFGAATDLAQEGPGSHSSYLLPSNRFVFAPVLGLDKIDQWTLDANTGKLAAAGELQLPSGTGPRHMAFHPAREGLALVADEGDGSSPCRLTVCSFDASVGKLSVLHTVSTLPGSISFVGVYPAEVLFSLDGRFAYVSNRDATSAGRDNIAVFSIGDDGTAKLLANTLTGHYPRSMSLNPTGDFIVVANQKGNSVMTFAVDVRTGLLHNPKLFALSDSAAFVTVVS